MKQFKRGKLNSIMLFVITNLYYVYTKFKQNIITIVVCESKSLSENIEQLHACICI